MVGIGTIFPQVLVSGSSTILIIKLAMSLEALRTMAPVNGIPVRLQAKLYWEVMAWLV